MRSDEGHPEHDRVCAKCQICQHPIKLPPAPVTALHCGLCTGFRLWNTLDSLQACEGREHLPANLLHCYPDSKMFFT